VDGPFWPGAGQPVRPAGTLPRRADAASSARPAARSALASGVSSRERAGLALLADGCSTRETAQRLCYSERTIKNVVQEITSRLHLRNRTQAVAYAVRRGWI
jgi:DNA-binding NarL/FixJ family response regulator